MLLIEASFLVIVSSMFLMQNTQEIMFPKRNNKRICLFECSMISLYKCVKRLSFNFVVSISILCIGNGICEHLLASSKSLRRSRKLSTKELNSLSELFTSSCGIQLGCVFRSQKWNNLTAKDFLLEPLLTCTVRCWDWELSKELW